MTDPRISVIIPAYNQAEYLGEAIQSVLDQTLADFEVIVVNDASPDHTSEVVGQFDDPRLKYLVNEENRGLPATRNTGMRASSGDLIALLDADDFFHPDKLEVHVDFLEKHPEIGVSYNNRFDLHYSSKAIRKLNRPLRFVELKDLVLGFPFVPSDMVMRRSWAFDVGLFDEKCIYGAEDIDLPCRLALAGCLFASVDKALNYRRFHSGRKRKNLRCRIDDALRTLEVIFTDPRCPREVQSIRNTAIMNHYEVLSCMAFVQDETQLGQDFLREAVHLSPAIVLGEPSPFVDFLAGYASADENRDHELLLRRIFAQLPPELAHLSRQYNWAAAQGYLFRGVSTVTWGRLEDGRACAAQAAALGAKIDEIFVENLTRQVLDIEAEFGVETAQNTLHNLVDILGPVGSRVFGQRLRGCYAFNRAFRYYQAGEYDMALRESSQAISNRPKYILNRGVMSVLLRSYIRSRRKVIFNDSYQKH